MSRWSDWPTYERADKRPPPADGIKVKKIGATWWGQRWTEALERMSRSYASRLPRGATYARAGRVHALEVRGGAIIAKVTGTREPYDIRLVVKPLGDEVWARAIMAMAERAQFAAALLGGEMPREIDAAFAAAGATLFPARAADLVTSCSCPDVANPCKHVAATHYVLGEAFDRDPFLLFELRGRARAAVLDGLRAARTPAPPPAKAPRKKRPAARPKPVDFDGWRAEPPSLRAISEEVGEGAALRQLGAPPAWSLREDPAALLGPALAAAASRAREIALGWPASQPDPPAEKPRRPKPRKR